MTEVGILNKAPKIHGLTRQGLKHTDNQDRFAWFRCGPGSGAEWSDAPDESIFVVAVADGVTTQAAGANASDLAINVVRRTFMQQPNSLPIRQRLEEAFLNANRAIVEAASQKAAHKGMSTTLVVAAIQGWELYVAHLGDSRVYLIRQDDVYRLTLDHTWIQEAMDAGRFDSDPHLAKTHTNRHNLTRHLGAAQGIQVDHDLIAPGTDGDRATRKMVALLELEPGDVLLLCSDGLYDKVEAHIGAIVAKSNHEPETSLKRLIKAALNSGETDDITGALLVMPQPFALSAPFAGGAWRSRFVTAGATLLALVLVAFLAFAFMQRGSGAAVSGGAVGQISSTNTEQDPNGAVGQNALAEAGKSDVGASAVLSPPLGAGAATATPVADGAAMAAPVDNSVDSSVGGPLANSSSSAAATPTGEVTPLATTTKIPTATPRATAARAAATTPAPVVTASRSEPTPTETVPVPATASSSGGCEECAVDLISPLGATVRGQTTFRWQPNFTLDSDKYLYEMVFWGEGQDPLVNGFGPAGSISNDFVEIDLDQASRSLPDLLKSGSNYRWGVVLVDASNPAERIKFLGGDHPFYFEASSGGSSSGDDDDGGGSGDGGGDDGGSNDGGSGDGGSRYD